MKILDIQHIDSDFDEWALAKSNIESNNKDKLPLTDFIKTLNVHKHIILLDELTVIPFNYVVTKQEKYLFICGTSDNKVNDRAIKIISNILIKSKFNILDNLKECSSSELLMSDKIMPDFPCILFNNKYWEIVA